jgi:NADH-quinone oxidoreductase subunit M
MDPHPTTSTLLSWIVFTPLIGVAMILVATSVRRIFGWSKEWLDDFSRWTAIGFSAAPCILGIWLWIQFDTSPGHTGLQFVHHFVWIHDFNIEYFVGVDGVSIAMVILSTLISLVAAIASMPWWLPKDDHDTAPGGHERKPHFSEYKVPGYMTMLLVLETGMAGVFVSMDFFLFYVFWELMLLPMYFLIGIWGGPRKEYAAIKFFLYTLAGSVLMLLAVIGVYYTSAPPPGNHFLLADGTTNLTGHTFNIAYLIQLGQSGFWIKAAPIGGYAFATLVWIGFFIAFAIKVPMFPFHTWLPDAHVEAPTPISVILAGILLKMGTYGMIRINWEMFPQTTKWLAAGIPYLPHQAPGVPYVAIFGTINIVYAAFVCMAQKDLKKLIAYSSVSHMGYCLLGMSAFTPQGMSGAMFNMWTHGLISPMLFLIAGVIYDRAHHREIEGFGGLAKVLPEYTGVMGLAFFASLGLPGLCGFISEFLCLSGAFQEFTLLTTLSATAVIITAAYYLWTLQRIFLGNLNPKYAHLPDLNWRERICLYPLGALVVVFGFYPALILNLVNPTLFELVRVIRGA